MFSLYETRLSTTPRRLCPAYPQPLCFSPSSLCDPSVHRGWFCLPCFATIHPMSNRLLTRLAGSLLLLLVVTTAVARGGENWPGFRGPTGLGYTDEANLPLNWGGKDGTNVLWS